MNEKSDDQSALGHQESLEDRFQEVEIDRNEAGVLILKVGQWFEDVLQALAVLYRHQWHLIDVRLDSVLEEGGGSVEESENGEKWLNAKWVSNQMSFRVHHSTSS